MMRICFIVTTYNILPYLEKCLNSVAMCARSGDKIIIVDDGSTDGTQHKLMHINSGNRFNQGVVFELMLLGTNTMGGVGIPANVGLSEALANSDYECVFFVDGDDWLLPNAFADCRRHFEALHPDILIANYTEYDQENDTFRAPADSKQWGAIGNRSSIDLEESRRLAISMISVPWRKFYSARFLKKHSLRFPEGNFFFEDNPFHWSACLHSKRTLFVNSKICVHRHNRPGQTMLSTGMELIAFFDHYRSILDLIEGLGVTYQRELRIDALIWLLTNMRWHTNRLHPKACWAYSYAASHVLRKCSEDVWLEASLRLADQSILPLAEALRSGEISNVASYLTQESHFSYYRSQLSGVKKDISKLLQLNENVENFVQVQRELMKFEALSNYGEITPRE